MKKKETQELQSASREDVEKMLKENRAALQALKFDLYAGKIKNVNEMRRVKKTIARLMTRLTALNTPHQ